MQNLRSSHTSVTFVGRMAQKTPTQLKYSDVKYLNAEDRTAYYATSLTARRCLEDLGIAIIPGVFSAADCEAIRDMMFDTLGYLTQHFQDQDNDNYDFKGETRIVQGREETYATLRFLSPSHHMLLAHHGIGQARHIWFARMHPNVLDVYSHLYGEPPEDLVTSFDGCSVYLPRESEKQPNRGSRRGDTGMKLWMHTDQNFRERSEPMPIYQSWITSEEVNAGDGTLVVFPRSHRLHSTFGNLFQKTKISKNYYKYDTAEEEEFWTKTHGMVPTGITCPAGSMVLWDSRTFHCGVPPLKGKESLRNVAYVCMVPRSWCSPGVLHRRIQLFERGATTAHSPHIPTANGPVNKWGGNPVTELPIPSIPPPTDLPPIGLRLVGYDA